MRVKFPDLPEKFMESELELNEELQTLHVIATTPEFYPILIEVCAWYLFYYMYLVEVCTHVYSNVMAVYAVN